MYLFWLKDQVRKTAEYIYENGINTGLGGFIEAAHKKHVELSGDKQVDFDTFVRLFVNVMVALTEDPPAAPTAPESNSIEQSPYFKSTDSNELESTSDLSF